MELIIKSIIDEDDNIDLNCFCVTRCSPKIQIMCDNTKKNPIISKRQNSRGHFINGIKFPSPNYRLKVHLLLLMTIVVFTGFSVITEVDSANGQHHPQVSSFPRNGEFNRDLLGRVPTVDLSIRHNDSRQRLLTENENNRPIQTIKYSSSDISEVNGKNQGKNFSGARLIASRGISSTGNSHEEADRKDKAEKDGKFAAAAVSGAKVRDGIVQRVPPSRPAPMYDKPTLKVTFDTTTPTRVLSAVGQTAYLHCRVQHLGDKVVTWIRKHDVHILTVALFTYTTDGRFTALHSEASNDWTLRIASPQIADSGTYECQVSTEPSISRIFQLQVVESQAHIDGPVEIHMMSGSNINLTCEVTGSPEAPQYIYWYAGNTLINYSERGGISVITDKRTRTSWLVVARATTADSGNYTCAPANAEPSSVSVYILNGEYPAAMQGGESTSTYCLSRNSVYFIAFIIIVAKDMVYR